MGNINKLTDAIINKIAAGEVIERPAFIVKELVDNAIDAGATDIVIKLAGYGLEQIIVTDNGQGMDREDVALAYHRHTTSKIISEADLQAIRSYGFRGEALSSIAAVSTLTISSRTPDGVSGVRVRITEGRGEDITTVPLPVGTQVIVSDIFSPVPARQKFLKSAQTEYRHILSVLHSYALSVPHIRLELWHNGQRIFLYPAAAEETQRLRQLLPDRIWQQLLPVSYEHEYITVRGFVSHPQLSYKSRLHHHICINGRAVEDKVINAAIKKAYGSLLAPLDYPYAILYVNIPHQLVDVNVHPRKQEVSFVDAKMVFTAVYDAISHTLAGHNLQFVDRRWHRGNRKEELMVKDHGMNSYAAETLRTTVRDTEHRNVGTDLLQVHNLYIMIPSKQGIRMIDQHAAHERILYERLMTSYREGMKQKDRHTFQTPRQLSLTLEESVLLREYHHLLEKAGIIFSFSEDQDGVIITSIPVLLQDRPLEPFMREILDELAQSGELTDIDSFAHTMITFLACRSAIKAGDPLTKKQMKKLVDELQETEQPYTCPHGRPIQVVVELEYFNNIFKR